MNKIYFWVGGETGTTSADRFDWNVASNWKVGGFVDSFDDVIELLDTTETPGYLDTVVIGGDAGTSRIAPFTATSPLLFGGFSGDVSNGGWTSGSYGATGTTWTSSLAEFKVKGNRSWTDFNVSGDGIGYQFNYPFKVIGGGLGISYGNNASAGYTYFYNVEGMSKNDWKYLFDNATARQKAGLRIKSQVTKIEVNQALQFQQLNNNMWAMPENYALKIYLELVHNYGLQGLKSNESSVIMNAINTRLYLNNSKVQQLQFRQPLIWFVTDINPYQPTNNLWQKEWRNYDLCSIAVKNSVIEKIDMATWAGLVVYSDSIIGSVYYTTTSGAIDKSYIEAVEPKVSPGISIPPRHWYLGGSYNNVTAALALRENAVLSGLSYANVYVNFTEAKNTNDWSESKVIPNIYFTNSNGPLTGVTVDCKAAQILGSTSFTTPSLNTNSNVLFEGKVKIDSLNLNRVYGYGNYQSQISVRSAYLKNSTTLTHDPDPLGRWSTNWYFGEIRNGSYYGGVIMQDESVSFDINNRRIGMSVMTGFNGANFINYTVNDERNTRTGDAYNTALEYVADSNTRT